MSIYCVGFASLDVVCDELECEGAMVTVMLVWGMNEVWFW